jgi:hypothetical protein
MKRRFLFLVSLITVLALIGFLIVLYRLDPCLVPGDTSCIQVSKLGVIFFYLSLFFTLLGVFTLVGFFLRLNVQGDFFYDQMGVSLRQGFLLAFISIISLIFLFYGLLTWWAGILLLAIVLLIELYFTARA